MHALLCMLALAQAFTLGFAAPYVPETPLSRSLHRRDRSFSGIQMYQTETFGAPVLQYTKTNKTAPGLLFFTPEGTASITNGTIIMADTGELVWQSRVSNFYTDLRTQSYSNQTYLTFWNSSLGGPNRSNGYGSVDFLDHSLNLAHRVCLANLDIVTPTGTKWPCQVDLHEAQMTNRNTLLVTVYNVTQADLRSVNGTKDGWILDAQFYEVDPSTEKILFSWKFSDHLDDLSFNQSHYPLNFSTYSLGVIQADPWDPFHINSIQGLDDGYLISSRHYWTIYKIFNNGTIDWEWQGALGDCHDICSLPPATNFRWQHHVRLNSTCPDQYLELTMFDNANSEVDNDTAFDGAPEVSIGTTYQLDMVAMTATLNVDSPIAQLRDDNDPIYSDSQGSHQVLRNGNILLGYGQVPKIKEFDRNGDVVYAATFGPLDGTVSFRAFRLDDWHADPSYPPRVTRRSANGTGTTVYMSWNGATDIDAWNVLAGPTNETLKNVAVVEKDGFETSVSLNMTVADVAFVQVEALGEGNIVGRSAIVLAA